MMMKIICSICVFEGVGGGGGCLVHAYVLMTNHAHLLVTPESSKAISALFQGIEAIKFRMEQQGLTQKDLDPYM